MDEKSFKKPPEKKIPPHIKRKTFRNFRKQFLIELKWKCDQIKCALEEHPELQNSLPISPIAAVTAKIEQLASKDRLCYDCLY